ncbi:hypothetical protein SAMN04488595_103376 [Ralstonia sp. 25mfcol4.1]|uniref:hypothetical protein n=1 Tax=Burkholderiaceae TaxID=119060 RepID=UPI00088AF95E|nr:hypothetical protein [Ralstonia sp. 25mfcol4.1]SDO98487.1 hypothetical protein SAMN04488595_103376 [Ralstonia sp. 25mfcol4.1]
MDKLGRSWQWRPLVGLALLSLLPGGGGALAAGANIIPVTLASAPLTTFDRSFSAAVRAFHDEGVADINADRQAGSITGHAGTTTISAAFRRQSDGTLNVQFASPDPKATDLVQRIYNAYNRRMGR